MSFDPQAAELSRALYEDSPMSVREIAALHGVSERSVYRYAARHNWRARRTRLAIWQQSFRPEMSAEKARMKRQTKPAAAPADDTRRELVARLWRAAARHVSAIEERVAKSIDGNVEQTDIASIASLSRSMQQLALLDRTLPPEPDDDDFPRSDDALRSDLLRKMEALIAGTEAGLSGEPDTG